MPTPNMLQMRSEPFRYKWLFWFHIYRSSCVASAISFPCLPMETKVTDTVKTFFPGTSISCLYGPQREFFPMSVTLVAKRNRGKKPEEMALSRDATRPADAAPEFGLKAERSRLCSCRCVFSCRLTSLRLFCSFVRYLGYAVCTSEHSFVVAFQHLCRIKTGG